MAIAALKRTAKRLAARAGRSCPACAGWPAEVSLQIDEVIVAVSQPLPVPDARPSDPAAFGPCRSCGRVHRARVIALED
jgi:hypothetical protein